MKISLWRWPILFVLCLSLGACLVDTGVPLSPFKPLPADSRLIGTWKAYDDGKVFFAHFGNEGDSAKAYTVEWPGEGAIKVESYAVSVSELDGGHYLNVRVPAGEKTSNVMLKYQILDDRTLILSSPDMQFLAKAIGDGSISGSAKLSQLLPEVSLTEKEPGLRQFVRAHSGEMFKKWLTFERVK